MAVKRVGLRLFIAEHIVDVFIEVSVFAFHFILLLDVVYPGKPTGLPTEYHEAPVSADQTFIVRPVILDTAVGQSAAHNAVDVALFLAVEVSCVYLSHRCGRKFRCKLYGELTTKVLQA